MHQYNKICYQCKIHSQKFVAEKKSVGFKLGLAIPTYNGYFLETPMLDSMLVEILEEAFAINNRLLSSNTK